MRTTYHPISAGLPSASPPDGHEWLKLSDVARLESGHTPSRKHLEWWGGEIPWLSLTDIRRLDGKHAYETTENTNDAGLANSAARILHVGTVCLSRTASIGFVTILGKPMATSQDFANWICDPEKLDSEFLMYALMASRAYLRALGSGAVHKTIYMPSIESFHVCVPDISIQRDIAHLLKQKLDTSDQVLRHARTMLAEAEALPQRILIDAFPGAFVNK
jgi:type I restriction enzyme S subunit